ncbi:hypothetical protein Tco_0443350 [Tanacetum coccineum]
MENRKRKQESRITIFRKSPKASQNDHFLVPNSLKGVYIACSQGCRKEFQAGWYDRCMWESKRMIDKCIREIETERQGLQAQEKKLIVEIKKSANQGQMVRCSISFIAMQAFILGRKNSATLSPNCRACRMSLRIQVQISKDAEEVKSLFYSLIGDLLGTWDVSGFYRLLKFSKWVKEGMHLLNINYYFDHYFEKKALVFFKFMMLLKGEPIHYLEDSMAELEESRRKLVSLKM